MTGHYNHCDPPERQIPLPVEMRSLPEEPDLPIGEITTLRALVPTASGQPIRLQLDTDSAHLAQFFSMNWAADGTSDPADARILALKHNSSAYHMEPDLDRARWYCPQSRQVWMFGNEYYGNIKITVRGLCSELAPFDEMFLHGCSIAVDDRGIVLSGMSGAGKTTLTATVRSILAKKIRIVNDDWGPFSLSAGTLRSTMERYLHMKYPSVRTLAPNLDVNPETHVSENFAGDPSDPRARLLIPPKTVFGEEGLRDEVTLRLFVVVIRKLEEPPFLHWLSPADISIIEKGQYSEFYERTEWYLNGSLFLLDSERRERCKAQHLELLKRYRCVAINNSSHPSEGVKLILSALDEVV